MVLRYFLRSWLHNQARQKVREKFFEAAREEMSRRGTAGEGEPDEPERFPCDVAVIFALGIEAGCFQDLLEGVLSIRAHGFIARYGELKTRRVVLVESGPGGEAAGRATAAVIAAHRPAWVISAGFAGGTSPQAARHDVVMADAVADAAGGRWSIDLKVDPAALAQTPGVHVGRLVTVDRVVRSPEEKLALGEKHECLAVDMETSAVAEACRREKVRFLAVRIISDPVDETLPRDVQRLLEQQGTAAKLGTAVGSLWRRPGSVKDMLRLRENALLASDRLATFLASTIEQLVPLPPAEKGEAGKGS